jgi:hypothetical protein
VAQDDVAQRRVDLVADGAAETSARRQSRRAAPRD